MEEELLLLELEPLLPGVGGHGVAEGGDVVTDVVNACLQHRGSESSSRALASQSYIT